MRCDVEGCDQDAGHFGPYGQRCRLHHPLVQQAGIARQADRRERIATAVFAACVPAVEVDFFGGHDTAWETRFREAAARTARLSVMSADELIKALDAGGAAR